MVKEQLQAELEKVATQAAQVMSEHGDSIQKAAEALQAQAPEIEKQLKAANIEAGTAIADGLEELSKKLREEAAKAEAAQQK